MIEVLVEVISEAAPVRTLIRAESLQEAVSAAKERFRSNEVRVVFPISPEDFFVRDTETGGRSGLEAAREAVR